MFIEKALTKPYRSYKKLPRYKKNNDNLVDITLIKERLMNSYYRSKESLMYDLKVLYEEEKDKTKIYLGQAIREIDDKEFRIEGNE